MNKKTLSLPRFRFTCNKTTEPPVTSPITAWMQTPCRKKNTLPFGSLIKHVLPPSTPLLSTGLVRTFFPHDHNEEGSHADKKLIALTLYDKLPENWL